MTAQHTLGPWRQGFTLRTNQTRRWTAEQIAANDEIERRMVFAIPSSPHGEFGRRIAVCEREEDARLVAAAPQLLDALEEARAGLLWFQDRYPEAVDGSDDEAMARIDAALAKATGSTTT